MGIKSKVTTVEQSKRLIELGIPADKASMVWTTISDRNHEYCTIMERDIVLPENIEGYAFTVSDLLGLLPVTINEQGHLCEFSLKKRWNKYYGVEYYCHSADFAISFLFCNTVIEALVCAIERFAKYHHPNTKRISNEQWISEYLKNKDYTSPTEIGFAHAKAFNLSSRTHHSAWASPICKRMVEKGILVRNKEGKYKRKDHEK